MAPQVSSPERAGSAERAVEPPLDAAAHERQRTSFGAVARVYGAARPTWPRATVAWLAGYDEEGPLAAVRDTRPLQVLDLGAGTGRLTRVLVDDGCRVTAVDPSEGMLAELERDVPEAVVRVGAAEDLPVPDGSVDAVTVGQAWHWVDAARAGLECARVLRPGGVLGIGWHLRDERVDWVRRLSEVAGRPDGPPVSFGHLPPLDLPPAFRPARARAFSYEQRLDVEGLVRLVSSFSYVVVRDDRDEVLERVAALGRQVAGPGGTIVLPYWTRCYRAVRRRSA